MKHLALGLAMVAFLAAACENPVGRRVPECADSLTTTMILQVQSVPDSPYVSCINGLRPGWGYQHLQAQSGRSVYWLDSDRMGAPFLTVETLLSCEVSGVQEDDADVEFDDVLLFKDVRPENTVDIVLVPEGPTEETTARALDILVELNDTEIKNRSAEVSVSTSGGSTSDRIGAATATGAHVIVISIRDVEEGTLTLVTAGSDEEREVRNLEEAIDEIEDEESQPSYTGSWYYVFAGGCVVYTFDAHGAGVSTIESDVALALGLLDAESLRQGARDLGYDI